MMLSRIRKYPLSKKPDFTKVDMPANAKILTAQLKDGVINIWALIDSETMERELHVFYVYGTGWLLQDGIWDMDYINSVQIGGNIWHVFTDKK